METTQITMDRNETEARALLAAGFKNKAAQKRASEAATRAFERVAEKMRSVYRGTERDEAATRAYFGIPSYPHEWNERRADAVRTHLPAAAEFIADIERIVALYRDIKAAPLLPTVAESKAAKERTEMAIRAMNPELREAFMAQAPSLTADFASYMRAMYHRLQKAFPDGVPSWVSSTGPQRHHRDSIMVLRTVCDTVTRPGPSGIRGYDDGQFLVLNDATLAREAAAYGEQTALQWFYKTNQKLGDLQNPKLVRDTGAEVNVKGERDGKQVELVQQRIINVSALGKLFHQFPSRIYVDGRFTTEEAYYKLFPPAA